MNDRLAKERIRRQWDDIASARCAQIEAGRDVSHDLVLIPAILKVTGQLKDCDVLDVGCGCGFLSRSLAVMCRSVVGVDVSGRMIEEAKARSEDVGNVRFVNLSVEQFARDSKLRCDVCVANMMLMTTPNLQESLEAIRGVIKDEGRFVFSIPHPCFWNSYRHDEPEEGFNYWQEHSVTAPFRITLDQRPLPAPTTYYHRSLQQYSDALRQARFTLVDLLEPEAPATAPAAYRENYRLPRFMVIAARPVP